MPALLQKKLTGHLCHAYDIAPYGGLRTYGPKKGLKSVQTSLDSEEDQMRKTDLSGSREGGLSTRFEHKEIWKDCSMHLQSTI